MQINYYKENKKAPLNRGELLAQLETKPTKTKSEKSVINASIWQLKDALVLIHKCNLVVHITETE
jgi:hypothetical protein